MTEAEIYNFVADHAGMNLFEAMVELNRISIEEGINIERANVSKNVKNYLDYRKAEEGYIENINYAAFMMWCIDKKFRINKEGKIYRRSGFHQVVYYRPEDLAFLYTKDREISNS